MHACPSCRVPLHGHEDVCPSCGTKQYARKGGSRLTSFRSEEPGVNWMPFVIAILGVGIIVLCALPGSWIGKLMSEGPPKEDPMDKVSYLDARNFIQQEISKGLTNVGAEGKFTWSDPSGQPVDPNLDAPAFLNIDTSLPDPTVRRNIIDPVKEYMEKAKIPTLTMTDAKSRSTWTYNVQPAAPPPEEP